LEPSQAQGDSLRLGVILQAYCFWQLTNSIHKEQDLLVVALADAFV
jgi:hypothetical protein